MSESRPRVRIGKMLAALFGPGGFLVIAVLLLIPFGIAHVAGWREHTSILCGTTGTVVQGLLGLAYVCLYLAAVLGAPTLAIGAGILALLIRVTGERAPGAPR
jgi:hypothetical protein